MPLEWKPSLQRSKDSIAESVHNNVARFYRIEYLGPRTFLLKIDGRFIARFRNEIVAKEYAERIENGE